MTQSLVSKLLEAANKIHKSTLSGTGNFMVASPYFSNIITGQLRKESRKEKIISIFNEESK